MMQKAQLLLSEALTSAVPGRAPAPDSTPELYLPAEDPAWREAWEAAARHGVSSMLSSAVNGLPSVPEFFSAGADSALRESGEKCWRMISVCGMVTGLLKEAGIAHAVLKGLSLCALYPQPEMRRPGDLDVWIRDPDDFSAAAQLLKDHGFSAVVSHSAHHENFQIAVGPYPILLELHHEPLPTFRDERMDAEVRRIIDGFRKNEAEEELLGLHLPVLAPTDYAFFLIGHMLQHWQTCGISLRILCDYTVFWQKRGHLVDRDKLNEWLKRTGIYTFACAATDVCVKTLGFPKEYADACDPDLSGALWDDIWQGSEFAREDQARMLTAREGGLRGLWKVFHKETMLSFPRASRCFLLWPVLYVIALFRFLRNNRRLRHVSTKDVLKQAKKRGELAQKLSLYEQRF